jgi:hypothetical protein
MQVIIFRVSSCLSQRRDMDFQSLVKARREYIRVGLPSMDGGYAENAGAIFVPRVHAGDGFAQ